MCPIIQGIPVNPGGPAIPVNPVNPGDFHTSHIEANLLCDKEGSESPLRKCSYGCNKVKVLHGGPSICSKYFYILMLRDGRNINCKCLHISNRYNHLIKHIWLSIS